MSYEAELAFATDTAREAGKIMLEYFRSDKIDTEWKQDNSPVTIADKTINEMLIDRAKETFPDHGVLGEELSNYPERQRIWVVDPIDGTVPFSIGMPLSTFSLALVDRSDGQPLVGVTYDPFLDELYYATKGGGAFCNDVAIHTSEATELNRGLVGLTGGRLENLPDYYDPGLATNAIRNAGARNMGFASFVYLSNRIAKGQLLGSIIGKAGAWDIAASSLIVREAGGVVTDLTGKPRRFDEVDMGCMHAANPEIHKKLMELMNNGQ